MISIQTLIDDKKCFEAVRNLRWSTGVSCPHCQGLAVNKRGWHSTQVGRQRYVCQRCGRQFDDLTNTVFEGHHQPLRVWIVCLYLMALNQSNLQIAKELGLNKDDVQAMTTLLREGIEVKKNPSN